MFGSKRGDDLGRVWNTERDFDYLESTGDNSTCRFNRLLFRRGANDRDRTSRFDALNDRSFVEAFHGRAARRLERAAEILEAIEAFFDDVQARRVAQANGAIVAESRARDH